MTPLTMPLAALALGVSRRVLQEILKRYPFFYENGNRKLFTPQDIEAIRAGIKWGKTP